MKSFRPKDGSDEPPTADGGRNREVDFHGQKRSNETASTTDRGSAAGTAFNRQGRARKPSFASSTALKSAHDRDTATASLSTRA